jgi:copper transport protein
VLLYFNQPVQLVGRGVHVVAPSGRRVERGAARVLGPEVMMAVDASEQGTYLVVWRVIAEDTHPAQGVFAFSVLRPSPPAEVGSAGAAAASSLLGLALQTFARALHFVGYALSFGVIAFRLMVWQPAQPVRRAREPIEERRLARLVATGVLLLLIAEPFALLAQTASLGARAGGPLDPEVIGGALDSSFGRVMAQRLAAALLLWVLVGAARSGSMRAMGVALVVGMALAFVDGQAAHATGTRPSWLGLGVNMMHVAAMAAWTGGGLALLAVWPSSRRGRPPLLARFSRVALASLVVLASSGTAMAIQHLGAPADFLVTPYGRTLSAKLALFLAALALALAGFRASPEGRRRWWQREVVVFLGILVLAGLLVSLPPPI